jgi:hypothetical protein
MKVVLITAVSMGGSGGVDDKGAPWDNDTDDFEMNELKNSCTQVLKNARLLRCERRREAVGLLECLSTALPLGRFGDSLNYRCSSIYQ